MYHTPQCSRGALVAAATATTAGALPLVTDGMLAKSHTGLSKTKMDYLLTSDELSRILLGLALVVLATATGALPLVVPCHKLGGIQLIFGIALVILAAATCALALVMASDELVVLYIVAILDVTLVVLTTTSSALALMTKRVLALGLCSGCLCVYLLTGLNVMCLLGRESHGREGESERGTLKIESVLMPRK